MPLTCALEQAHQQLAHKNGSKTIILVTGSNAQDTCGDPLLHWAVDNHIAQEGITIMTVPIDVEGNGELQSISAATHGKCYPLKGDSADRDLCRSTKLCA